MSTSRLNRTREELSEFLRSRRIRISPVDVGLPMGRRRRTPGLRREEVAALAGVGLTWYTWFEQGRDISVSSTFLDRLSQVLALNEAERRYLFLLAHRRFPIEKAQTWCVVPATIRRLIDNLPSFPAYILNLRWDVLMWNDAADRVFGFSSIPSEDRNLLWMLFIDPTMKRRFVEWDTQALQMLSSFRRYFTQDTNSPDITALVEELTKVSSDFRRLWRMHNVHSSLYGIRQLSIDDIGMVTFEQTTLTIDEDRHLRLIVYAAIEESPLSKQFEKWLAN